MAKTNEYSPAEIKKVKALRKLSPKQRNEGFNTLAKELGRNAPGVMAKYYSLFKKKKGKSPVHVAKHVHLHDLKADTSVKMTEGCIKIKVKRIELIGTELSIYYAL